VKVLHVEKPLTRAGDDGGVRRQALVEHLRREN